jgi:histone H3/H4
MTRMLKNLLKFHPTLQATELFHESLRDFVKQILEISTSFAQHHLRMGIHSQDVENALRTLSHRYFSIVTIGDDIEDEDYLGDDEEEEESEEEEISDDTVEEQTFRRSVIQTFHEEKGSEFETIDLTEKSLDLERSGDDFERLLSRTEFSQLLLSCWSPNIPSLLSHSAFEALYAIVEHHVLLNLEGSPRLIPGPHSSLTQSRSLFDVIFHGYHLPFGVVCRLLNERELNQLTHQESRWSVVMASATLEQRELNTLLKVSNFDV